MCVCVRVCVWGVRVCVWGGGGACVCVFCTGAGAMGGGGEEKLSGRSSRACHTTYTTSMYRIRPAVLILPTVAVISTKVFHCPGGVLTAYTTLCSSHYGLIFNVRRSLLWRARVTLQTVPIKLAICRRSKSIPGVCGFLSTSAHGL